MSELNERSYEEGTVYENVVGLLSSHALHEGVVLDLGCGFGPIAASCAALGLDYVGVDVEQDGLEDLAKQGFSTKLLDLSETAVLVESLEEVLAGRPLAAITLLEVIEHLAHPGELLAALAEMAGRHTGAPLIVSVSNVSHFDLAAKLVCGRWDVTPTGLLSESNLSLFAPGTIEVEFRRAGWGEIKADDFATLRTDQHFPDTLTALSKGTPLHDFLFAIRGQSQPGALVSQFVRAYLPVAPTELRALPSPSSEDASEPALAPFLSVIVRTQGRRLITLEDNLTSLAAQTNRDFEVIVCCHDTSDANYLVVAGVMKRLPPWLVARTRAIRVEGGGRAHPLVAGVAEATGRYVAFLDDDDLAFCHWVEEFAHLVELHPGTVVRAGCATHSIDEEPWDCGVGYRQTGPTQTLYPLAFDLLDHMVQNSTPNCSVAIPRSCFTDLGVNFDDDLPVLEDWDVLLRASVLCGLSSTPEVTSLYRRWRRGYASHIEHPEAQWESATMAVRGRLDARPFLVPPGTVSRVVELQLKVSSLTTALHEAVSSTGVRLDELQLERDELFTRLEETEQLLADSQQRIVEITAAAESQVAEAISTADQRVAEATATAAQRVAEAISTADQRVAEATATADQRVAAARADADQRVAEIMAIAEERVAQTTAAAEQRVSETTAATEQRIAEITVIAQQRVAEITAIADTRLFQRRTAEAQAQALVQAMAAERDAALVSRDQAAGQTAARVRAEFEASTSWKLTAPLRALSRLIPGHRPPPD